jgi:hypothetical protein
MGSQTSRGLGAAAMLRRLLREIEPTLRVSEKGTGIFRPRGASTGNQTAPQGHTYNEKERINMVSRLSMVGRLVLALLAVFAFGAVVASAAWGSEPTRGAVWRVNGSELKANETRALSAKVPAGELVLEGAGGKLRVKCKEGDLAAGSFIANENAGQANAQAISESKPEFSNCKVEGNEKSGEKCERVEEPIKVKTVRSEVVLNDLEPGRGRKVLFEFDPRRGEEWIELKFPEAGCKLANTIIKGLTVALAWNNSKTKEFELGENIEETSAILKWSDEPKSIYLYNTQAAAWGLFEPTYLKAFSEAAKPTGEVLISVANNEKFGLVENPY